ncbi:helix-turn-helix domain-containing protein [Candidatus Neptunochlamydia vexilliferae]|uniref:helix-turn-helix domain-containing protein n=1 Tax=Candidatus Neptunichlamydia vexilliferae TaxID=1651774 RepID=UPI001E3429FF|nr:helix-turn-helix transcriptional regulator [Candidatus Neptunochlamydia vexilliferae]
MSINLISIILLCKMKEKTVEFHTGSGNLFKDLGFENPEEALAKSKLARQIYKTIKARNLTQKEAAEILGIERSKVSGVTRGNLSKYSLDRLMRFVCMLGSDIEIRIKSYSKRKRRPKLEVREEGTKKSRSMVPKARRKKKVKA